MITMQVVWYWLHLLGVIIWAGGFFYLVMAFIPAMNAGTASLDRSAIMERVVARFRRVSWIAIALLVVTGLVNFVLRMRMAQAAQLPVNELLPPGYMHVLGIKLVIVVGLILHHVARMLDPRELDDGRIGLKSKATVIVTSGLFIVAILLGVTLMTL